MTSIKADAGDCVGNKASIWIRPWPPDVVVPAFPPVVTLHHGLPSHESDSKTTDIGECILFVSACKGARELTSACLRETLSHTWNLNCGKFARNVGTHFYIQSIHALSDKTKLGKSVCENQRPSHVCIRYLLVLFWLLIYLKGPRMGWWWVVGNLNIAISSIPADRELTLPPAGFGTQPISKGSGDRCRMKRCKKPFSKPTYAPFSKSHTHRDSLMYWISWR